MPASAAARRYTLLVCADVQGKVKESSETQQLPFGDRARRHGARRRPPSVPAARRRPQRPPPQPATPQPTATETATDGDPGAARPVHDDDHLGARRRLRRCRAPRFAFTASQAGATLRVPARRRAVRRLHLAARAPEHPRRRAQPSRSAPRLRATRSTTPARKAWRIEFEAPAPGPAPAAARARPRRRPRAAQDGEVTLVSDTTEFLYTGADPIQKGVAAGRDQAAARGGPARPRDRAATTARSRACGSPCSTTPSSAAPPRATDGGFEHRRQRRRLGDAVAFEREGYVPSQRQLEVPTQDYERVEEIVLVPYEDQRLRRRPRPSDELQVAQGSTITDGDGTPPRDAAARAGHGRDRDAPRRHDQGRSATG